MNRVGWSRFEYVCTKLLRGYEHSPEEGDVSNIIASAWCYLDQSRDGFVNLEEAHPKANDTFMKFRAWCKRHFQSVHKAFVKLDVDDINEVSFATFRTACKRYEGFSLDELNLLIAIFNHDTHGHGPKKKETKEEKKARLMAESEKA